MKSSETMLEQDILYFQQSPMSVLEADLARAKTRDDQYLVSFFTEVIKRKREANE